MFGSKPAPRTALAAGLSLYALAMALRCPPIVLTPNFWGEEGAVFFTYARGHGWLASLLQSPLSYLNLWANLACTAAAKLVPLEAAPLVTMLFSFAVQLAPAAIVLTSRGAIWDRPGRRLLGLAVILTARSSKEVWLNSITSQFHFALIALLILLEPEDLPRARRYAFRALLLLAGLSGAVTGLLIPVFLWCWLRGRGRERGIQGAVLLGCLAVQAAFILLVERAGSTQRFEAVDLFTFASILWTRLALVFAGDGHALAWSGFLTGLPGANPAWPPLMGWLLALVEVLFFGHLVAGVPGALRVRLAAPFAIFQLALVFLSTHGGKQHLISPFSDTRYFFVPNVLLLLMALAATEFKGGRARPLRVGLSLLLFAAGLFNGIREYRTLGFRYADDYPAWRQEVARWRKLDRHPLRIWPAGWTIELKADASR